MKDGISRRDFLNGVALTIGAGLAPLDLLRAAESNYPPALSGMRGSTDASAAAAHALRDGRKFAVNTLPVEDTLDLVVIGAGISGLAAAYYFRQQRRNARILLLDNHDDFGGHARRCEMQVDGRLILGYGGSEAIEAPNVDWSENALALLSALGVDLTRFETAFDRSLYPGLGLSRGILFTREAFGVDKLVTGDPTPMVADDIPPDRLNARSAKAFIDDFPLDAASREKLIALYTQARDVLPGKSVQAKEEIPRRRQLSRFSDQAVGPERACSGRIPEAFAGLLRRRRRQSRRARRRLGGLSGLRRTGLARGSRSQSSDGGAVHLSLPRRQRLHCAPARAQADSRGRARFDDGRHRHGAVRLFASRRRRRGDALAIECDRHFHGEHRRRSRRYRLSAQRRAQARPGRTRRLCGLQLDAALPDAGTFAATAHGARPVREGAARLREARRAQLAGMGEGRRARSHEPDGFLFAYQARLSRQPWRLQVREESERSRRLASCARPDAR